MKKTIIQAAISFAIEDFVTPGHDEVMMRICSILEQRGIQGSFHLTGEFARYLRRENRHELIKVLRKHEIGYHSNTHGCLPFIGDVCENNNWNDAVAVLMEQESRGIMDITEITGKRPVYYVLEFLKAPQLITAIKKLGIDLFGIAFQPGGQAFTNYCGGLHLTAPLFGVESPPEIDRLDGLKQRFDEFYNSLGRENIFKIFNHPYKFLYDNQVEAWHSVNPFYAGYDIHQDFKAPQKSLYSENTVNQLLKDFTGLIDYVLDKGGRFKTTSELAAPYRVKYPDYVEIARLTELAAEFEKKFDWIENRNERFCPAEIFGMLVYALNRYFINGVLPEKIPLRKLLGPTAIMRQGRKAEISLKSLQSGLRHCDAEMDFEGSIPHALELCGKYFTPGDLRLPLLKLFRQISRGITIDKAITIYPGQINPDISSKSPFCDNTWSRDIYPRGFSGHNICAMAANQGWTFKPLKIKQ